MKRSVGIIGIAFWAPFFLSIPLGSIITAKFYGDNKNTFFFDCLWDLFKWTHYNWDHLSILTNK